MTERVDRAVILAAGLGERLKWLTRQRPKALMPIAGRPAIEHVILRLASQGVREIVINVHYCAEQIMAALEEGASLGVQLRFSREKALLDSGGGVRQALEGLSGGGRFALHNADVMADIDLNCLDERCPEGGGCLALVPNPAHHPDGDFDLNDGLLVCAANKRHQYTYAGVAVFDEAAFAEDAPGEVFGLMRVLQRLMQKRLLCGMVHRGEWLDVGRPQDLWRARKGGNDAGAL